MLGSRIKKRLVDLAPYLVALAAIGGGFITVLLVALVGRMRRLLRGTAHTTTQHISIWPPSSFTGPIFHQQCQSREETRVIVLLLMPHSL